MPQPFETLLAERLDELADAGAVTISESDVVAISGLMAIEAKAICELIGDRWPIAAEDAAESETPIAEIRHEFEPFRLVITKPIAENGRLRLLTICGFRDRLAQPNLPGIIEHARVLAPFETQAFKVVEWGGSAEQYSPSSELRSPRELVRETAQVRQVPSDLRPWLLQGEVRSEDCPVFRAWAANSAINVARSLVTEVLEDGRLTLRGVMRLQFEPPTRSTFAEFGFPGFRAMQRAAHWIYENAREAETRLGLFVNEMSRSARHNVSCAEGFQSVDEALEGARLAFQLGLEGLSKDTMKALSDLRKSLSDETAKLSDISRQLALAVAGSIFLGMGAILTKSASNLSLMGALFLGLILSAYVAFVGLSGHQFIELQKDLRNEWRRILYRFISDSEYRIMVDAPSHKAERNFYDACVAAGLLMVILFGAIMYMFS